MARGRWSEDGIREWFYGDMLSNERRRAWLKAVDNGPEIPLDLLDTLPADRRMDEPGSQVLLMGAYWPEGKRDGEPVELKPTMLTELKEFLKAELRRRRESGEWDDST